MKIDIHTHLGRIVQKDTGLTIDDLIANMDRLGIDKSVVLPLDATPEGSISFFTNQQVLEVYKNHPDRIIPFCKLDPRQIQNSDHTDFSWLLKEYKDQGCRGVGEVTASMYFDDPKCVNLFRQCGQEGMPVLFHLVGRLDAPYGLVDDIYLPRLERVLKELPGTVFIGHAMAFWAEIASDVTDSCRGGYPKGPISGPGKLPQLLSKYPNLYADLSAGSGFNAIHRDGKFGIWFLEKYQDKLLLGTDICVHGQDAPIVGYLDKLAADGSISAAAYEKIICKNALKILN